MISMLRFASSAIFSILVLLPAHGQSLKPSPTSQEFHSRARLISGGTIGETWLAGIEITLDPGYKTYWRNPGESGLPPRFDWSGSRNVAAIDLRWPAPSRHEDAAGIAHVYSEKVIFPVLVKPADPTKPVELAVAAEYGVCKEICIPARTELKASLSAVDGHRTAIEAALARVPQPQALGSAGDLSILSVIPVSQDKPGLSVTVRAPAGTTPELFAEGPDDWYVSTSPLQDGQLFTVTVEDKPKDAVGPVPLRLTLVAGERAIETEVSLDGSVWSR